MFICKHIYHVAVNVYQKRGWPHIHVLLFVDIPDEIFYDGIYIDQIVSAEFPPSNSSDVIDIEINQLVETFMIHKPCGTENNRAPCMVGEGIHCCCSKGYPKPFNNITTIPSQGSVQYKRKHFNQDPDSQLYVGGILVDNSNVVPYNPYFLYWYKCHINIEILTKTSVLNYLMKHLSKKEDRSSFMLQQNQMTRHKYQ